MQQGAQRGFAGLDCFPLRGGELVQSDADDTVLHNRVSPYRPQENLAQIQVILPAALEDLDPERTFVKRRERGRHILPVHQQPFGRLGQAVRRQRVKAVDRNAAPRAQERPQRLRDFLGNPLVHVLHDG
jgi:hypothetical protein